MRSLARLGFTSEVKAGKACRMRFDGVGGLRGDFLIIAELGWFW